MAGRLSSPDSSAAFALLPLVLNFNWLQRTVYLHCRLQAFVDRVQAAASCHSWQAARAQPSVSPTLAAFAASLAHHMHPMWAELVRIEEELQPLDAAVPKQDAGILLKLEYQLQVCLLQCC